MSPMTMQSYSTFSVGGTVCVNAHGITNDRAMVESVVALRVVTADGEARAVRRGDELFGLVIGGYGLFGVVTELTLRAVPNVKVALEMTVLRVPEFRERYERELDDVEGADCVVKIARIDITTGDSLQLFVFRHATPTLSGVESSAMFAGAGGGAAPPPTPTISTLADHPNEMSFASRLLYKWVMPRRSLMALRFSREARTLRPIDFSKKVGAI